MNEPVKVLCCAISGYGYYYLKTLFEEIPESRARLVGVIDPTPEKSDYFQKIESLGIPVYSEMSRFFLDGHKADLTVISSPIHYHMPQTIMALQFGSHVLVDKPLSGSAQEVREMMRIRSEKGLTVEVGYQWSFSDAIRTLKSDIASGLFGRPKRMKTICLWPRDFAYYARNNWAGRILSADGKPVLDSPANNACAHFLHNMFYLLDPFGSRKDESIPAEEDIQVTGQRFRAYDIENYDTVLLKARMNQEIDLFFYASHVTEHARNPEFVIECEQAEIRYRADGEGIRALFHDGRTRTYGAPDDEHQFRKLFMAIDGVREKPEVVCPPEIAVFQTLCIEKLQGLPEGIIPFTEDQIEREPGRLWVRTLGEKINNAYESWHETLR